MKAGWPSTFTVLLRWALALVFAAAAFPKILQPAEFALAIFRYQLVPYDLVNLLAVFLPWLELVCALALILGCRWRQGALWLLLLMLIVFTTAIGINLYRGIDIACGCFSVNAAQGHLGWLSLLRNTVLMASAGWLLRDLPSGNRSTVPDRTEADPVPPKHA